MNYAELSLQRKIQIENTLLELMEEVPYEQITVQDLTQKLGTARKTFYRYFPNKQSCLESLTDRMIYECNLHVLQNAPADPAPYDIYVARLRFWAVHKNFLDVLIRNHLSLFMLERFMRYLSREDKVTRDLLSTPKMKYDEDILFFYMSGQLFLLLKWCSDGFPLSVEEMAQKYLRLLHEPLLPPEEA